MGPFPSADDRVVSSKEETLRVSNLQPANFTSAPNSLLRTNQLAPPNHKGAGQGVQPHGVSRSTRNRKYLKMKVKVTQSCPTLCDPRDYTVHEILQARILEWVATYFSRRFPQPRDRTQVSHFAGRFFTSWATRVVHPSFKLTFFFFTVPVRLKCSKISRCHNVPDRNLQSEIYAVIQLWRKRNKT